MCKQKKEYLESLAVVLMITVVAIIIVRSNSGAKDRVSSDEMVKMEKTTSN